MFTNVWPSREQPLQITAVTDVDIAQTVVCQKTFLLRHVQKQLGCMWKRNIFSWMSLKERRLWFCHINSNNEKNHHSHHVHNFIIIIIKITKKIFYSNIDFFYLYCQLDRFPQLLLIGLKQILFKIVLRDVHSPSPSDTALSEWVAAMLVWRHTNLRPLHVEAITFDRYYPDQLWTESCYRCRRMQQALPKDYWCSVVCCRDGEIEPQPPAWRTQCATLTTSLPEQIFLAEEAFSLILLSRRSENLSCEYNSITVIIQYLI